MFRNPKHFVDKHRIMMAYGEKREEIEMALLNDVILAMIEYDRGDRLRINHFMKVYGYASLIARTEGVDERTQRIVDVAGVLHDIGIHPAERKYGNCMGRYQEELGPAEADALLTPLGIARDEIERVMWLIAHHHTYGGGDAAGANGYLLGALDHQILVEADFLVNLDEGKADEAAILSAKRQIFRTETGLRLLNRLFGV